MRPLSVGELLDAAFSAVRRNFGALVLCTLVVVVPVSILNTLITASSNDSAFDFAGGTAPDGSDVGLFLAGSGVTTLLTLLSQTLTAAACLRIVGGDVVGSPARPAQSLGYAARRLGPLLWVTLLYALAILVGVVMCFVGAIWLGVLFSLATPALLFEEKRGRAAMRRSRQLIADHWWRVFGALIVGYLIVAVLQGMLGGLLGGVVLVHSDSQLLNATILTAVNVVVRAISLPLLSALVAYVYFDLRVRKEGFDLALLARGIGGSGDAAPAGPVDGLPAPDAPPASTGFLPPQPPPPGG